MGRRRKPPLSSRLKATIKTWYLNQFHDPAEIRLLEVLGGITLTIGNIKHDGKTMTIVLSRGKLLRSENFKRVALDNRQVLYMNDLDQVLAIQPNDYQYDVLKYQEQEEMLAANGKRVKYIPQSWLENNPIRALQTIQHFIYY